MTANIGYPETTSRTLTIATLQNALRRHKLTFMSTELVCRSHLRTGLTPRK